MQAVISSALTAPVLLIATALHADPAQGFFYESVITKEFPDYWQELYFPQFESATKVTPLFADDVPQCWVTVSPVADGSAEATLVDMTIAEDGILFGVTWLSYDDFEALMRQTNCS